ncbi:MAG: glycosyltransferase family 2 protein [Planctomycetota bacterium]|nr:glycosyltransferase family 2 protein [Planctomycetota bacterium]
MPKISVCIPTYNSAKFIQPCLESVLNQTLTDIEVIVSDNASTDDTTAIIESINDSRIQLYRQTQNIGSCENFNFAISEAKSSLVKSFCSDDIMIPNLLDRQKEIMDAYSHVGIVSCYSLVINADKVRWVWEVTPGYETGDRILCNSIKTLTNRYGGPSSFMYRREAIKNQRYEKQYGYIPDVKLPAMIMRAGWDYYGIPDVGIKYICHPNQETHSVKHRESAEWLQLMNDFSVFDVTALIALISRGLEEELETIAYQYAALSSVVSLNESYQLMRLAKSPSAKESARRIFEKLLHAKISSGTECLEPDWRAFLMNNN